MGRVRVYDAEELAAGSDPYNGASNPNDVDGDGIPADVDQDDGNGSVGRAPIAPPMNTSVPGFEMPLTILAMLGMAVRRRRRKD